MSKELDNDIPMDPSLKIPETFRSDVFATEDGTINTKVIGWVTNVIVAEQSSV